MKREKTKYQGVYFYLKKRLDSTELEKAYYIMYRQGGRGSKLIEEPVGRESEGMTSARAAHIRADRARKVEMSNTEKRATEEAARLADISRPSIARLRTLYRESLSDRKRWETDESRYRVYISSPCLQIKLRRI